MSTNINPLDDEFRKWLDAPGPESESIEAPEPKPGPYCAVPQELKDQPNWVVWGPTKIPYNPKTGIEAEANNPATWGAFAHALAAASDTDYAGIGFELGRTKLAGIDFDNVIKKGVVDPYVMAILELLGNPYADQSPSGTGLHAFVECDSLPPGKRKLSKKHEGVEIYRPGPTFEEGGRYFTVTGVHVSGAGIPKIEDMALPYLLLTQCRDKKFKSLWLGDTAAFDGDDSSADFALLVRLAALTQNDPAKMEAYFSASQLGQREKWTDRADYRERTIRAAIEANRTGKMIPPAQIEFHGKALPDPNDDYVIAPAEGQGDGWFPLGDVSLIGGASGTGKTTLIFELLWKQRNGMDVLGHKTFGRPFHVLAYDRGQNAFERTMIRLKLGNLDIPTTPLPLAFGTNAVQNIINEIEKMNPIPQVVFIEGLDMLIDDANKKSIVSPFMKQLQEVAAHFHLALIGSLGAPKTKRGEDYAAKRDHLSGSEAWGRNGETVAILEFSEDDDGTAPRRELTVLPRNAKAEKFSLIFENGRLVKLEAPPEEQPEDPNKRGPGRPDTKRQAAIEFLLRKLQDGPRPIHELIAEAKDEENISRTTLYEVRKDAHIKLGVKMDSEATWELIPIEATADIVVSEVQEPVNSFRIGV